MRKTDRARAKNGTAAMRTLLRQFHSEVRGTPRERYAAATMAVVVNDGLTAKRFCLESEAGRAKRSGAGNGSDHSICGNFDSMQR